MKWPELERTTIVAVAGLGRCGTSLLMQMLDAGGFPVAGTYPGYEVDEMMVPMSQAWARLARGRAIKMLDPQRWIPPRQQDYRMIWLDRDLEQQATSQLKLLERSGMGRNNRKAVRGFKAQLERERAAALRVIRGRSPYLLELSFENVIRQPRIVSIMLDERLGTGLDIDAMVAQIRPRGPECLRYMLETSLIADGSLRKDSPHAD